ncbi:MAG: oligosaccharide flippase family protein [archaeon]
MYFKDLIKSLPSLKSKFGQGVIWNIGSLGILGIVGILLNILIARFYGAEILGVFNQAFAFYILASQIAVWGMHFSVLKHISQFSEDKKKCNSIISSSIILTIVISLVISIIIYSLKGFFGGILGSENVKEAVGYIAPAIFFFAINKLLLYVLNGFRHMKNYAFSNALRYVMILVFLIIGIILGVSGNTLPIIFTLGEFVVLCWLIISTSKLYSFTLNKFKEWAKKHLEFGNKIMLSGTLHETNTRVDILMLGIFTSDAMVGIYSLASIIAEGVSMIYIAVKANVNPILTKLYFKKRIKKLREIIKKGVKAFYILMFAVVIISIILYPFFLQIFMEDASFYESWYIFIILLFGILLSSGYLPFNQILIQTGFPGWHTIMIAIVVASNILLNLIFIPLLGLYGAAIATSLSFIISMVILKVFVKKLIKIQV